MAQQLLPVTTTPTAAMGVKASGESASGGEQLAPFRSALQLAMEEQSQTSDAKAVNTRGKVHTKHASQKDEETEGDKDAAADGGVLAVIGQNVLVAAVDLPVFFAQAVNAEGAAVTTTTTKATANTAGVPDDAGTAGIKQAPIALEKGQAMFVPDKTEGPKKSPLVLTDVLAGVLEEEREVLDGLGAKPISGKTDTGKQTVEPSATKAFVSSELLNETVEKATIALPVLSEEPVSSPKISQPIPQGFRQAVSPKEGAAPAQDRVLHTVVENTVSAPIESARKSATPDSSTQTPVRVKSGEEIPQHPVTSQSRPAPTANIPQDSAIAAASADLAAALSDQTGSGEKVQEMQAATAQTQVRPKETAEKPVSVDGGEGNHIEIAVEQQTAKKSAGLPAQGAQTASSQDHGDTLQGRRFQAPGLSLSFSQPLEGGKEAAVSQPTAMPPQLARSIVDQVIKGLTLTVSDAHQEMRVTLKPESLGEMTVQVKMTDGKLHAQIDVSQQAVKTVIESQMTDLHQALQDRGIDVQRIEVFASGQSSNVPDGQSGRGGRFRQKGGRRSDSGSSVEEIPQARSMGYNTLEVTM